MHDTIDRHYTAQIRLRKSSDTVGKTLAEAIERSGGTLKVEKIQRGPNVFITPLPDVTLKAGDRITTTDTRDNLREFAHLLDSRLFSGAVEVAEAHPLALGGQRMAEVAVTTRRLTA